MRFSDREMRRRHEALEAVMTDVDHVLVHGANRSGTAVGWLTRWPVTREAIVVVTPGECTTTASRVTGHPVSQATAEPKRLAP